MQTFEQFIRDTAQKGEVVNLMFEERLFDLVGVLHKITDALASENIPHELIGGLAVLIHVEEADPAQTALLFVFIEEVGRTIPGCELDVEVDYLDEVVALEASLRAHLWLVQVLAVGIGMLLSREHRQAMRLSA